MARILASRGALVAGIDSRQYLSNLKRSQPIAEIILDGYR